METLNLAGTWNLVRLADSSVRPMRVPGDIYSALIASRELADPYYGENELDAQWPGREDWRIERTFILPEVFLQCETLSLVAESIDTVAEIYVNGEPVGTSANMFRRFDADPRPHLHHGENNIAVVIRSPELAAARAASALPYPIPASIYPVSSPHRNLIRKAQCMSGWDWGPCLMTGGIYDGIRIIGTDGPLLRSVRTRLSALGSFEGAGERGPDFSVEITAEVEAPFPMDVEFASWLAGQALQLQCRCAQGISTLRARFTVKSPKLWWPNGAGQSALYDLHVAVWRADTAPHPRAGAVIGETSRPRAENLPRAEELSHTSPLPDAARLNRAAASTCDAAPAPLNARRALSPHLIHRRIGFRELCVIAEEDKIGRSFTLHVNGRDIFAKGANWIPADALPSRWTRQRTASLLDSAARAHMNCLRVWGGGRYESDEFYDLCDERGIMLWQDCMFSCALYPSDKEFLENVEQEISWQVKRLTDHPSLALWCGNNEALGAITWYDDSRQNPARYIVDYDRLTEGVLGRVIRELDPDRCFWPSSPSAGPKDFSDNWHSDERGDMHFWSVWHEGKPFSEYQTVQPRFCSEFGFQAFPSLETIASFAPHGEWNISSPAMEAHQRHPRGNSLIIDTMLRYFRMPKGFTELLYLSQVQQALAIRTAVQYWRSAMPRCMGTLYWQLNDVWPVTSWSSLNYDGSWKLLHYEAVRFYAPVILALFIESGQIRARLVSETAGDKALDRPAEAEVALRLLAFDGKEAGVPAVKQRIALSANSVQSIWDMPLDALPRAPNELFIEASLTVPALEIETEEALFLTEPKRCALRSPGLDTQLTELADGSLSLSIEATTAPAFFVAPELTGTAGQFEDSGFYLPKGKKKTLRFEYEQNHSPDTPLRAPPHSPAQGENLRLFHLQNSFES